MNVFTKMDFHILATAWEKDRGQIATKWGDPAEGQGNPGYATNKFYAIKSGLGDSLLLLDFTNQQAYFYIGSTTDISTLYSAYSGGTPSSILTKNMWDSYTSAFSKSDALKHIDTDMTFLTNEGTNILDELSYKIKQGISPDNPIDGRVNFFSSNFSSWKIDQIYLNKDFSLTPTDGYWGHTVYSVFKDWAIPKSNPSGTHIYTSDSTSINFDNPSWSSSGLTIHNGGYTVTVTDKADNKSLTINADGEIGEIIGGFGSDTIVDGDGWTNIISLYGNNVIDGGGGMDTLSYFLNDPTYIPRYSLFSSRPVVSGTAINGVKVSLETGKATFKYGTDTFQNIENVNGSMYNDRLIGNAQDNVFNGHAGNDYIDGGAGTDTLEFWNSPGGVAVNLSSVNYPQSRSNEFSSLYAINRYLQYEGLRSLKPNSAIDGWGTEDKVFNFENINGTGSADILIGNDKTNFIYAGGITDSLWGEDIMIGKGGADYFNTQNGSRVFYESIRDSLPDRAGRELSDVIDVWSLQWQTDRWGNAGTITLDLSSIDGNTTEYGIQNFNYINRNDFSGTAGELRLNEINYSEDSVYVGLGNYASEACSLQGDVDGDMVADFEIKFVGVHAETFDSHVNILSGGY